MRICGSGKEGVKVEGGELKKNTFNATIFS